MTGVSTPVRTNGPSTSTSVVPVARPARPREAAVTTVPPGLRPVTTPSRTEATDPLRVRHDDGAVATGAIVSS
jgi:hypothetical protein